MSRVVMITFLDRGCEDGPRPLRSHSSQTWVAKSICWPPSSLGARTVNSLMIGVSTGFFTCVSRVQGIFGTVLCPVSCFLSFEARTHCLLIPWSLKGCLSSTKGLANCDSHNPGLSFFFILFSFSLFKILIVIDHEGHV